MLPCVVGINPYIIPKMLLPHFLVYCTGAGKYVLSVRGEKTTRTFSDLEDAVTAARVRQRKAPLVVYNAMGNVVLDTVT